MRHDDDQRSLPKISGLASHVGPGEQHDQVRFGIQQQIVRNEALCATRNLLFDHGMACFDKFDYARIVENRTCVPALGCDVRQGQQDIGLSKSQRRLPDPFCLTRDSRAQFRKKTPFDLDDLLFGFKHFGLILLQLRRCKALSIDQRLLALEVGRN